jgi:tetratricopeptide (TPR) repeat protein
MILSLLVGGMIAQSFALVAVSRAQAAEAKRRTQTRAALDAMSSSVIEGWLTKQPVLQPEHTDFLRQAVRFYEEFAADTEEDEESRRGTAAAMYRVGRIREQLGEHTEAKKVLQRCCDHYQALLRDFPSNRSHRSHRSGHAAALLQLQLCRWNSGEYADSEEGVRQAVKTYRELVTSAPDDREASVDLAAALK